jgi:hypothetical protein
MAESSVGGGDDIAQGFPFPATSRVNHVVITNTVHVDKMAAWTLMYVAVGVPRNNQLTLGQQNVTVQCWSYHSPALENVLKSQFHPPLITLYFPQVHPIGFTLLYLDQGPEIVGSIASAYVPSD